MLTIGSFANAKHLLEKEVFNGNGERILSVCTVTKTYKKKKACYLCIVSVSNPQPTIFVYQIKQVDRDGEYKKKRVWSLQDIKVVDGKSENAKIHEFDIQCEKTYKWYAINLHERQNFLTVLYKQINKQIGEKAEFKNILTSWKQDQNPTNHKFSDAENMINKTAEEDLIDEETEDFHILTEKEILELNNLIQKSEFAIKDAENFINELSSKLYNLDGANIQSVLASEKKVFTLMQEIEKAVEDAEKFEKHLDAYDEILGHVRETMEKIGGKNAIIETANNNNIKLLVKLNKILTQFDLPSNYQICLSEPDLKTNNGRIIAVEAGKWLQKAMSSNIDPSLLRLTAIQDQMKRFEKLKAKFSLAISRHLNNLFIHLGNDLGDMQSQQEELEISLSKHKSVHNELIDYSELMHWIKAMDKKSYDGLVTVYTKSLSKIYERDLKNFFNQARLKVSSQVQHCREDFDTPSSSKSKLSSTKQLIIPYGTLGVNKDMWGHCVESSEREKFDEILEKVLTELEPIALQEQVFCVNFFQLDAKGNSEIATAQSENELQNVGENESDLAKRKNVRQINEDVRNMMISLFGVLETELLAFIQSLEKLDSFYSLYVLVRLTQHVMTAQDTQSFLSMTFASALVYGKRSLDRFMQQQLQSIQDCKVQRKSKCGILPYVDNFEDFAKTTEEIFRKSDRRTDMDKWYVNIVNSIFEAIPVHGNEFSKTPMQVVKMENYHHMYALLAQLKIPVLEESKKIAKARYNDALKSYVTMYFGRPLEKLNLFFEGVQQKVSQGVKETEISYQMAFSKQELRKVISQYPVKEVKKGLENLYKKVEKHLCEEENLLQVVWHAMQEEFIAQYIFLEERIQKCYAGAMISLEFTIHDILTFFSDIARSH